MTIPTETTAPTTMTRDENFKREVAHFGLRFRCAACAHVIASTRTCSMGYPNAYLVGPVRAREDSDMPVICKYWELGETEHDDV